MSDEHWASLQYISFQCLHWNLLCSMHREFSIFNHLTYKWSISHTDQNSFPFRYWMVCRINSMPIQNYSFVTQFNIKALKNVYSSFTNGLFFIHNERITMNGLPSKWNCNSDWMVSKHCEYENMYMDRIRVECFGMFGGKLATSYFIIFPIEIWIHAESTVCRVVERKRR